MNPIWNVTFLLLTVGIGGIPVGAQSYLSFSNRSVAPNFAAPVTNGGTGQPLAGLQWRAQMYYATAVIPEGAPLNPAAPIVTFRTEAAAAGFINSRIVELADVEPGTEVTVQVRVWNASAGETYEEAAASSSGIIGESIRFKAVTGTSPENAGDLSLLRQFSVAPAGKADSLAK